MALFRAPMPRVWEAFIYTTEDEDDDPPLEHLTANSEDELIVKVNLALQDHDLVHRFTTWYGGCKCDVYGAILYDSRYA